MARADSRTDRRLRRLQALGVTRGVLGTSRAWFWVAVVAFLARNARRAIGSEYEVVYRGELRPGEGVHVDHLTETRAGGRVRARRRRIRA
ncbi:MAG TPA: hypothetical protein VFZ77_21465 [Acidimicrobiales bacterium]